MTYPKITIITPSYNQGQYLEETILSVLDQQYPNLEYIIIDGGSTDHSVAVIKKYADRLTHWVSEKDKGTYDAINKALDIFTGDYWCVVNSDDTLQPGTLHEIARYVEKNQAPDWITGGIHYIDEHSTVLGTSIPVRPEKTAGYYFLTSCWIHHPVTFLSRRLYQKVGKFSHINIMDYDYWIRSETVGYLPVIIDKVLGSLRFHEDCKSMNFSKIQTELINLWKNKLPQLKGKAVDDLQKQIIAQQKGLLQSEIKYFLFHKKYGSATSLFIKGILRFPIEIFRRWPYGIIKRYFTGVREEEFSPKSFVAR